MRKFANEQDWLKAFLAARTRADVAGLLDELVSAGGRNRETLRTFDVALASIRADLQCDEETAVQYAVKELVRGRIFNVAEGQHR
jgi:hypothetical protein